MLVKLSASFYDMSPTASFQRVWETLRYSVYDHKNEQLRNVLLHPKFLLARPDLQDPKFRLARLFLLWLSIQCHGASKKVAKFKTGA